MTKEPAFRDIARDLHRAGVRFVVIGVSGVNFYAESSAELFSTSDTDLFLPSDPENLLAAWRVCEESGMELWANDEPLDMPRDLYLATRVVERRAAVAATHSDRLQLDLTLVMAGFKFEPVWEARRLFRVDDVEIPVARLEHIVRSKATAGREKDRMFLVSHRDALRNLRRRHPDD